MIGQMVHYVPVQPRRIVLVLNPRIDGMNTNLWSYSQPLAPGDLLYSYSGRSLVAAGYFQNPVHVRLVQ